MRAIVVDHSINGPGGHYLSYALSILDAAKLKGYETVLVTGVGFHPDAKLNHRFIRAYEYDFFGNTNVSLAVDPSSTLRLRPPARASDAIVIWNAFVGPLPVIARFVRKIVKTLLPVLFIPQLFHLVTGRSIREARSLFSSFTSRVARGIATRMARALRARRDRSAAFCANTLSWLQEVSANENDLILFPTISFQDCRGLAKAIRSHGIYRRCLWRLLFRRNLFPGDRRTYDRSATDRYRQLIGELSEFAAFFTDSTELSDQYRFAFATDFRTLPIPHAKKHLIRQQHGFPLCVSYIGDARTEKGFHLLPRVVEDCGRDPFLAKNVRFVFQSNYNIPEGEPLCVVAKSQLQLVDTIRVELLDRSLSPTDYDELLSRSDVGLLPYLRENYSARTSGALIEYLSAGIPVIVPNNTWLAAQFEQRVFAHQRALANELEVFSRGDASFQPDRDGEASLRLPFNGECGFLSLSTRSQAGRSSPISILVTFQSAFRGRHVRRVIFRESPSAKDSLYVVRIPKRIEEVAVEIDVREDRGSGFSVSACTLLEDKVGRPLSAVGLTYDSDCEIAGCIEELSRYYGHYKTSALCFAEEINAYHNAASAVERLRTATEHRHSPPQAK